MQNYSNNIYLCRNKRRYIVFIYCGLYSYYMVTRIHYLYGIQSLLLYTSNRRHSGFIKLIWSIGNIPGKIIESCLHTVDKVDSLTDNQVVNFLVYGKNCMFRCVLVVGCNTVLISKPCQNTVKYALKYYVLRVYS